MRIVVVGGGAQPDSTRLKEACLAADTILAADSGAAWLAALQLKPDVLLGDFDSLDPALLEDFQKNGHTRWVRHREDKDQTDMELCVEEAIRLGATEVRLFGGIGTRMDHSLANLMLLYPFLQAGIKAWMEDVNNRIMLMGRSDSENNEADQENGSDNPVPGTAGNGKAGRKTGCVVLLEREEGFKVSLLALPPGVKQVETFGLRYDMRGRDLPFGSTLAVSNEFDAPVAEIRFQEGLAWLLVSRDG